MTTLNQLLIMFPPNDVANLTGEKLEQRLLARAIAMAAYLHRNDTDKGGKPYITHPIRVMMRLRTEDWMLQSLAIMHDVLEDCSDILKPQDLLLFGFTQTFIDNLKLLSKLDDSVTYDQFIENMRGNNAVISVKMEDIKDNSDVTRLKGLRQKDFDRMQKYSMAYAKLRDMLNGTEKFKCSPIQLAKQQVNPDNAGKVFLWPVID